MLLVCHQIGFSFLRHGLWRWRCFSFFTFALAFSLAFGCSCGKRIIGLVILVVLILLILLILFVLLIFLIFVLLPCAGNDSRKWTTRG